MTRSIPRHLVKHSDATPFRPLQCKQYPDLIGPFISIKFNFGVLKSAPTLHKILKATFAYPTHERLPKIAAPTLVSRMDGVVDIISDCLQTDHGFYDPALNGDEEVAAIAQSMRDFLDA